MRYKLYREFSVCLNHIEVLGRKVNFLIRGLVMKNGLSLSRNDACALGGRRGDPNKMYERHPYVGRASLILESVAWHLKVRARLLENYVSSVERTPLWPLYTLATACLEEPSK